MRSRIFSSYDLKLYVAPFYLDYNFVPLRDAFFETLAKKVWSRSSERPRPREGELLRREYAVLRALSSNGREEFTKIDSDYGLSPGSARYTYHRFMDTGMIKRITISMHNVRLNYISAISLQKINHVKFVGCRQQLLHHIIDDREDALMNRYALVGDMKMPEGVFLLMPVRNDRDVIDVDEQLRKIDGAEVDSMIVTNVIVGSPCYRRFDNTHSSQYSILRNDYGLKEI
jgi:DNA-binding Lrp family transcriptional regulator